MCQFTSRQTLHLNCGNSCHKLYTSDFYLLIYVCAVIFWKLFFVLMTAIYFRAHLMYFHVMHIKLISYSSLQINKNDTFYISNDTNQLLWRHYSVNDGFKNSIHIEILPFKGHFQEYCDFIAFLFCYDLDCFFLQSWVGANLNITTNFKKWNFDNYYNHTLIMFIIDLSHFLKWIATHETLCCFYLIKTWLNF